MSERSTNLEVRVGNKPGWSFRLKALSTSAHLDHESGHVWNGTVTDWTRVAVCVSHEVEVATWVLEPATDERAAVEKIEWGGFYVRGRFRRAEFVNGQKRAALAFKAFEPR